ncbi:MULTISPECIES: four-helix bundle copper-binding protein [unclassified Janthinobacterium]|uniref:four-helix bundle copper-binding protein n=1 Tax=unclassified Janthinobacterium TaxID=2610881 RepID=UPI0003490C0C|nr:MULTISPECIES: four-helix bundle copper-binding protein [unclassified Janthinobacterium]MEC5159839.1 hypothetical protein [Janthinobacterium sp. CG_S6]
MSQRMFESCIDACHLCANACDHCAVSCLAEADVARMARCIAVDVDCAQICRLAAGFMARGSESAAAVCRACVDACNACADECARHAMQHCQDCALACRRCADACRRMAAAVPLSRQRHGATVPAAAPSH